MVPSPTKSNICHLRKHMLGMRRVFRCLSFFPTLVLKGLGSLGVCVLGGGGRGCHVCLLVYLFCCFQLWFSAFFQPVLSSYWKQCAVFVPTPVHILCDRRWCESAALISSHSLLGQFDSVFLKWGEFIIHALQIYFTGFLWLQVWVRQRAVLSVPGFPLDLRCLWKIHVCWHWLTQISVCTFCLSGSRYWEHHSVYVRRGSGSSADCPHVVSFQWPPLPLALSFFGPGSLLHGQERHCPASFVYAVHSWAGH